MKANETPEKIYVHVKNGKPYNIWNNEWIGVNDVEYIRKDAFIDKAYSLLERMIWEITYEDLEGDSTQHYDKMEFIKDFVNYMKGE